MRPGKVKRIEYSRIAVIDPERELSYRKCVICGAGLDRNFYGIRECKIGQKLYPYLRWETTSRFLKRKTCSKECKRQLQSGEGNSNYKGIMPRCIDCGKKIAYKGKKGNWTRCERCFNCFKKWAKKTNYYANTPQAKYIAQKMRETKGIYPEQLKPFGFQKGHPSWLKGKKLSREYKKKISETRLKRIAEGKIVFNKTRLPSRCIVCGKISFDVPYRAKKRRTCSFSCSGKVKNFSKIKKE